MKALKIKTENREYYTSDILDIIDEIEKSDDKSEIKITVEVMTTSQFTDIVSKQKPDESF